MIFKPEDLTKKVIERFVGYISANVETGCWNWRGKRTKKGYGHFWLNAKTVIAMQVAYVYFRDVVPDGLELDHLCRNTSCVNPDHLEPVTRRENLIRGNSPIGINARKTHCCHGHIFDEANTYYTKEGFRLCRACARERAKERYHANPMKFVRRARAYRKANSSRW